MDAVEAARSDLSRSLELNPRISFAYPEQVAAEVIAARWDMANQQSPEGRFQAADRAATRAMEVNPENSVAYQSAAEVHRWRAEWELESGRSVTADVKEGRKHIRESLARNPGLVAAFVTDAGLLAIEAEAEPSRRVELSRKARQRLDEARKLNPLVTREIEPILRRLDGLDSGRH